MSIKRMFRGREEYSEAQQAAQWFDGKGQSGLESARKMFEAEMIHRSKKPAETPEEARAPMAIEGRLGDEVVYREGSPGGNCPRNMNKIPAGREDEVSYFRIAYDIA